MRLAVVETEVEQAVEVAPQRIQTREERARGLAASRIVQPQRGVVANAGMQSARGAAADRCRAQRACGLGLFEVGAQFGAQVGPGPAGKPASAMDAQRIGHGGGVVFVA